MRVWFEDGSFVDVVESTEDGKAVTLVICGINGKNVTMSSAELDIEQTSEMYETLSKILEKEKEDE